VLVQSCRFASPRVPMKKSTTILPRQGESSQCTSSSDAVNSKNKRAKNDLNEF